MIEKIREIIKKDADADDWKYHFLPVVKYSKLLAKKLKANEEVVEIAALLHDIGRLRHGGKEHEKTGIKEAEKILKEAKVSEKIIKEVKHCIATHRGSTETAPKTVEAKIVANADAMAHFDELPGLVMIGLKKKKSLYGAVNWVYEKIERDWNKKLTIPEAKAMMKEKYKAIKLLLDSMKQYEND